MKLSLLVATVMIFGVSLAGCGSSHSVKFADGTIVVGRGVREASLLKSVLGISIGTEATTVRARLGEPFARVTAVRQTCWAYHADQSGTSVDAIDFCMSPAHRVKRISIGVHG